MLHTLTQSIRMLQIYGYIFDVETTHISVVVDDIIAWDLGGC